MSGNYENGFKIHFEDDENNNDIYSSSTKKGDFEDIASSSSEEPKYTFDDFYDIASSKEKKGLAKVCDGINDWWHSRIGWQKALLIVAVVVLFAALIFAIWHLPFIEMRGKVFCTAFALLALNIAVYCCIYWKRRKAQSVIMGAFSVLLSGILILSLFFWLPFLSLIYNFDSSFSEDAEQLGAVDMIDKDIINIALFGIDTRSADSFSGNSDSIMILSLNKKTHKVKIISIMRDSLVPIEKNGKTTYGKINSAYAGEGGAERAVKTLNKIFGLDITEYATVNFFGMAKIIDAVGGIDVELTDREVSARGYNNHGINDMIEEVCRLMGYKAKDYYVTKSGKQHLNGIQAVAYSRIRYVPNIWGTNNDYGRTDRQRYVMEQLFNKALNLRKSSYPSLIKALIPYTVTSLSPDEILSFALTVLAGSPQFEQARMPQDDYLMKSPSGSFGSVVYYDLDFAKTLIHAFIYDDITFEEYTDTNGITKNSWYKGGYGSASGSANTTTKPSTTTQNNEPEVEEENGEGDGEPSQNQGSSDGSSQNSSSDTPSEDNPQEETPPEEETPDDNPIEDEDTQGNGQDTTEENPNEAA